MGDCTDRLCTQRHTKAWTAASRDFLPGDINTHPTASGLRLDARPPGNSCKLVPAGARPDLSAGLPCASIYLSIYLSI